MLHDLLFSLESHRELSPEQIRFFLDESISGKISLAQQAAVLSSLNTKGISSQEMASFAQEIAQKMTHGVNIPDAIDICGTGGSGLDRINTSTISAFILSALGVRIAKHGNRASSGRFGSFDLLEHLKIDIGRGHRDLEQIADQTSLAFLYAPQFHPSMKHFAGVRKELGIPTVFNLLGPLLNPTNPQIQIIGTPFRGLMNLIAETAKRLGKKRVMVVCGEDGLDEVTLSGKTYVTELLHGRIRTTILKPSHFGIASCDFEKIKGSKPAFNTHIALDILKGTCQSRHLDLVLVNTALALKLAGVTSNLRKAYEMAQECVASGNAYQQFIRYHQASHTPSLLLEIVGQKKKEIVLRKRCFSLKRLKKKVEPSTRDFRAAILRQGIGMIAEIKKASPQEGVLRKGRFDVGKLAENFEKVGVCALSVVTDQKYFQGEISNLQKARQSTQHIPILCKDFIIDEYQVFEARYHGADAVLLMASLLNSEQIQMLLTTAKSLNMDCLVEIHTETELQKVLTAGAEIIGINNRDLNTFKVDLKTTQKLSKKIPKDKILVSESGIASKSQIRQLPSQVDAILVGTSLMKSKTPHKKVEELMGPARPLLKVCGVQSVHEARICQKLGVDFIGLNFVPGSERMISYQLAEKIVQEIRKNKKSGMRVFGVFQDQSLREVNGAATNLKLDFVQLSGAESTGYIKKIDAPVVKGVSIQKSSDLKKARKLSSRVKYLILDGPRPGSGEALDHKLLKDIHFPYFLAGGIDPTTAARSIRALKPYGLDVASGVETKGKRDLKKIQKLVESVKGW